MQNERFIEEIEERTGVQSDHQAAEVGRATLAVLGAAMVDEDRESLAEALEGASMREALLSSEPAADAPSLEEFYEQISDRTELPLHFAAEFAQGVCQVLRREVDAERLDAIVARLPEAYGDQLFFEPETAGPGHTDPSRGEVSTGREVASRTVPPGGAQPQAPAADTLAEGRPGSNRPISEARPDDAHTASVARDDNPRGDHKLSSGPDAPTGDRTLSEGRPGSTRPLDEYEGEK
jgi:uncharacterized protein (DUF2267 family)